MSARDARSERAPVLLEREPQRARIATLLDDVREETGALVLLEGPAGIGKTELVRLAVAMAADAGIEMLQAHGGELEAAFPFGVVRQLFESAVASAAPAEQARLLAGAAGGARPVVAAESAEGPPADAHSVLHGLYWLVANLADRAPVLVIVDDLHWADRPSLRFLAYLANRLEGLPVGLLLAARTGEAEHADELSELGARAEVLALPPLSEDGVSRLVAAGLDGAVDTKFASACEQVTAGNPYLVRELLATLAGDGVRPTAAAAERLRTVAPKTVARAVLARLARLSPAAGRLANAVAVLGLDANLSAAADLAALDLDEAADAADVLAAASILTRDGPWPSRIRWYAAQSIRSSPQHGGGSTTAVRPACSPTPAPRLRRSRPTCSRPTLRAIGGWSSAWRSPARRPSTPAPPTPPSAISNEPSPSRPRPRLRLRCSSGSARRRRVSAAARLRRSSDAPWRPRRRALTERLRRGELARSLHMGGSTLEAARVLEETIAGQDDPPPELEADLLVLTQSAMDARRHLAGPLGGARARAGALDGPTAPIIQAVVAVDLAHTDGTASQAIDLAEHALAGAQAMRHGGDLSVAFYLATVALALGDRLSEANAILDRSVAAAQHRGSLRDYQSGLVLRSWILHRMGRMRDAEADARLALEEGAPAEADVLLPWKLAGLAESLMELGELERAGGAPRRRARGPVRRGLDPLPTVSRCGRPPSPAHRGTGTGAGTARRGGRMGTTLGCAEHQLDFMAGRSGARSPRAWNGDEARALATEDVARAKEFGAPRALGIALRAAGMAAGKGGLDQLTAAVEVLAGSQAELELLARESSSGRRCAARGDRRTLGRCCARRWTSPTALAPKPSRGARARSCARPALGPGARACRVWRPSPRRSVASRRWPPAA